MPVVIVYGLTDQIQAGLRNGLRYRVAHAVASIPELNLAPDLVDVFLHLEDDRHGITRTVVAFVEGLFEKPERTPEVRQRLAASVGEAIVTWLRADPATNHQLVEVLIKRFDPERDGFFSQAVSGT